MTSSSILQVLFVTSALSNEDSLGDDVSRKSPLVSLAPAHGGNASSKFDCDVITSPRAAHEFVDVTKPVSVVYSMDDVTDMLRLRLVTSLLP